MNDDPIAPAPEDTALNADAPVQQTDRANRIFLCVVDNTAECKNAVYFAARRAARTGGRLALLYIMEPAEFQHWMSVEEKMREEAREEGRPRRVSETVLIQRELPSLWVVRLRGVHRTRQSMALSRQTTPAFWSESSSTRSQSAGEP